MTREINLDIEQIKTEIFAERSFVFQEFFEKGDLEKDGFNEFFARALKYFPLAQKGDEAVMSEIDELMNQANSLYNSDESSAEELEFNAGKMATDYSNEKHYLQFIMAVWKKCDGLEAYVNSLNGSEKDYFYSLGKKYNNKIEVTLEEGSRSVYYIPSSIDELINFEKIYQVFQNEEELANNKIARARALHNSAYIYGPEDYYGIGNKNSKEKDLNNALREQQQLIGKKQNLVKFFTYNPELLELIISTFGDEFNDSLKDLTEIILPSETLDIFSFISFLNEHNSESIISIKERVMNSFVLSIEGVGDILSNSGYIDDKDITLEIFEILQEIKIDNFEVNLDNLKSRIENLNLNNPENKLIEDLNYAFNNAEGKFIRALRKTTSSHEEGKFCTIQ